MKWRFVFDTWQRKGIFGLILIIFSIGIFMVWDNSKSSNSSLDLTSFTDEKIQKHLDSLKNVKNIQPETKIYPFNPNFITDYKAYTLGMKPEEFDRLQKFRDQDRWINSVADFQKVTQVSDSLLNEISPYFKFPDWVVEANTKQKSKPSSTKVISSKIKKDLNSATEENLMEIRGIGEVLSKRIIRYRSQIGGFIDDIQLKDIYGLNYETRLLLLEEYSVQNPVDFEKIDLNKAEVLDLIENPYIDYELARKIINYRITREGIRTFDELAEIQGFPFDKTDRLQLYLKIENIREN